MNEPIHKHEKKLRELQNTVLAHGIIVEREEIKIEALEIELSKLRYQLIVARQRGLSEFDSELFLTERAN